LQKEIYPKLPRIHFRKHLYHKHRISELTFHEKQGFLLKNFMIIEEMEKGWCKNCMLCIPYGEHGLYIVQNHYEMFHSNNAKIFETVLIGKNGRKILNKFILIDKEAACILCKQQINIEHLNVHIAKTLIQLAEHYFSHDRYEDNFLIFVKTTENRFCFTCFFFFQ